MIAGTGHTAVPKIPFFWNSQTNKKQTKTKINKRNAKAFFFGPPFHVLVRMLHAIAASAPLADLAGVDGMWEASALHPIQGDGLVYCTLPSF